MYVRTELVDKCRKKGYNDSPDEKSEVFLCGNFTANPSGGDELC